MQDLNDDNEWERVQGNTFPPFTGPDFDHTFGNVSGIIHISFINQKESYVCYLLV